MSSETPINPDIEKIIRESLAATKSWEWADDDRKWSAAGAATKWLQANSTMSDHLAQGMALKIVEEIMKEEEPTDRPDTPELDDEEQARIEEYLRKEGLSIDTAINLSAESLVTAEPQEPIMRLCPHCGQHHYVSAGEFYCPLDRNKP